jgi:maltooligosyltrehalose trehalohydrolase
MLFMGEEYCERRPFPFFVDHTDPDVLRATNEGRRAEFSGADWSGEVPEPGALATFESAVLDPTVVERDDAHAGMLAMYTEALRVRREYPTVAGHMATQQVSLVDEVVVVTRTIVDQQTTLVINLTDEARSLAVEGSLVFTSDDARWGGDGATVVDDGSITIASWTTALVAT